MRYDLLKISDLIKDGSSVLDIGCGEGNLIAHLKSTKNCRVRGIEIDKIKVQKAVAKGLSVMQGDADSDLEFYPNNSYDYVVMAETLQATKMPNDVLSALFRIGAQVVVSIPNFGHYKNRWQLLLSGIMPVNNHLSYQWYETPNIHFCTIKDFENLCAELKLKTDNKIFISGDKTNGSFAPNLMAEKGIFVLHKKA